MGRKRFRQYSLKRRVRTGRGKIKVDARESFFSVKIPTAIACISTRENIIELWTIGQNFPAVSYLGAYTFINCMINLKLFQLHNKLPKYHIISKLIKDLVVTKKPLELSNAEI